MSDGGALPELPAPLSAQALRELDDAALDGVVDDLAGLRRATEAAMAPYARRLREVAARVAEVDTERRRRERARRHADRVAVRERAASGDLPALAEVLAAAAVDVEAERPLAELRAWLRSGGEVGFGFATRPGTVTFTDGRQTRQARTLGEARSLYADGWEPGAPGTPGVRVHLVGTRVERVTSPEEVVIDLAGSGG